MGGSMGHQRPGRREGYGQPGRHGGQDRHDGPACAERRWAAWAARRAARTAVGARWCRRGAGRRRAAPSRCGATRGPSAWGSHKTHSPDGQLNAEVGYGLPVGARFVGTPHFVPGAGRDAAGHPRSGNPTLVPPPHDAKTPPGDLRETTTLRVADEALREAVDTADAGRRKDAAAAAWHAEPLRRLLCTALGSPVCA